MSRGTACPTVTRAWLRRHPLPPIDAEGDKEARGRVLLVGGSSEIPGAAILGAEAALRSGAGKVTIISAAAVATAIAIAVPEARVEGARETMGGGLDLRGVAAMRPERMANFAAVVLGPGLPEAKRAALAVRTAIRAGGKSVPTILDASAMDAVPGGGGFGPETLLTPHAGELAHLTGRAKDDILRDPAAAAVDAAREWKLLVLLKGPTTILAAPDGALWQHVSSHAGLGTSGSGDVLAGVIAGIVAQGVDLPLAAAWGVALHAGCAERLERNAGALGYLARELVAELPAVADELRRGRARGTPMPATTDRRSGQAKKQSLRTMLVESIRDRKRLRFVYSGRQRIVEPQCYGIANTGKELLRGHQLSGGAQPEPLFEVAKMSELEVLTESFNRPGPNYTRDDSAMVTIYSQL